MSYARVHPVRDPDARREWALAHDCCMVCWKPWWVAAKDVAGLCVHHLVRWRRSDEPRNFMLLCMWCHDLCHDGQHRINGVLVPKLTLGMLVRLKRERDPEAFDLARLVALRGQPIEEEEPPAWVAAAWRKRCSS